MPNYNHCTFMGHLGGVPEVKTAGNSQLASFSMAVKAGWGEKATTMWVRVQVWGKRADVVAKLNKGDPLLVSGELSQREYTTQAGEKRTSLELNASDFAFVGSKSGESGGNSEW